MRMNKTFMVLCVCFLTMLGLVNARQINPVSDDVYAYFSMNGSLDDYFGQYQFSSTGTVNNFEDCKYGGCYGVVDAGGGNYLTFLNESDGWQNNASESFWFKSNSSNPAGCNQASCAIRLVYSGTGTNSEFIYLGSGGNVSYNDWGSVFNSSLAQVTNNDWHLFVHTWNSVDGSKYYWDGQLIMLLADVKQIIPSSAAYNNFFGYSDDTLYALGFIDDYAKWSHVLTPAEILNLWNETVESPPVVPNEPPVMVDVHFSNITPNKEDAVFCYATATDADNTSFYLYWDIYNGTSLFDSNYHVADNNTEKQIYNLTNLLNAGEIWNCSVYALDGINASAALMDSLTVNEPVIPADYHGWIEVLDIHWESITVYSGEVAYCNFTLITGNDTTLIAYYELWLNDVSLGGDGAPVLNNTPAGFFWNTTGSSPGDVYNCTVHGDNVLNISSTQYAELTIGTPPPVPVVSYVEVLPALPVVGDNLSCSAVVLGEYDNYTVYSSWFRNGSYFANATTYGVTNDTLTTVNFLDGVDTANEDNWRCSVQAYDGVSYSLTVSDNVNVTAPPAAPPGAGADWWDTLEARYAVTGSVIGVRPLMVEAGRGVYNFIDAIARSLPILLIVLGIVGVFVSIGLSISEVVKRGFKPKQ